jgi:hypothetical protein
MNFKATSLRFFLIGVLMSVSPLVMACPTCGNKGFSKEMLLMTMGFALLPLSIMFAFAWRILREDEQGKSRFKKRNLGFGNKKT